MSPLYSPCNARWLQLPVIGVEYVASHVIPESLVGMVPDGENNLILTESFPVAAVVIFTTTNQDLFPVAVGVVAAPTAP